MECDCNLSFTQMYPTQQENTEKLCAVPVLKTREYCPDLVPHATDLQDKYVKVFSLFQKCHRLYNSNVISADEILTLGKYDTCRYACTTNIPTFLQEHTSETSWTSIGITSPMHLCSQKCTSLRHTWYHGCRGGRLGLG